jgi:hypothetical protein
MPMIAEGRGIQFRSREIEFAAIQNETWASLQLSIRYYSNVCMGQTQQY